MKTRIKWALVATILLLFIVVGCSTSIVSLASRTSRDWQFVQAVGGIALGSPQRDSGGRFFLPIHCDVSGTQTITVRPATINSALVCDPPTVRIQANSVFLTVRTTATRDRHSSARCPAADLGKLAPGKYSVIYLDPDGSQHPLGSMQISP